MTESFVYLGNKCYLEDCIYSFLGIIHLNVYTKVCIKLHEVMNLNNI